MDDRKQDPFRGRSLRWTFTDGPTAGTTFEHTFHEDGTVAWNTAERPGESHVPSKEQSPGPQERVKYAAVRVADDVHVVSYLAASGYTLTVALNFNDHRMYGFASNDKEWYPAQGHFEPFS